MPDSLNLLLVSVRDIFASLFSLLLDALPSSHHSWREDKDKEEDDDSLVPPLFELTPSLAPPPD
jgi:hypothetical protein